MTEKGFQFHCELKEKSVKAAHKSFHANVTAFHAFLAGTKDVKDLKELLQELNASYKVDLHSCLTVQVENLHAIGHFKDQFPTALQYARNLGNTVYDSIKLVVRWVAYYYTHVQSYYPVIP